MLRVRTFFGLIGLWFNPKILNMLYGTTQNTTYTEYGAVVGTSTMSTINSQNYYTLNGGNKYATEEATLSFKTTLANLKILIEIRASSSTSDYMCAGLLDSDSISTAQIKVSGTLSLTYTYTVALPGNHYIKFFFRNSNSSPGNDNKGYFRLIPFTNSETIISNTSEQVEVKSYSDWLLYSKSEWIASINPQSATKGKINATITATPNYGSTRLGNITLQDKKGNLYTLPINLGATSSKLELSRNYVAINDDAGSITVNVKLFGSTSWSVPQGSWYTISPTSGGDGAEVTISWGANTGNERSASLVFTGNAGGQDTLILDLETYICHCDCNTFCSCNVNVDCPSEYSNSCSCDTELQCSCNDVCGCDNNSGYCNCDVFTDCSCDSDSCSCDSKTGCGVDRCSCDTEKCSCNSDYCNCNTERCSCDTVCSRNYDSCSSNSITCSCDGYKCLCDDDICTLEGFGECKPETCTCDSDVCDCNSLKCTCDGDLCSCDSYTGSTCTCDAGYCSSESYKCVCDAQRSTSTVECGREGCSATGEAMDFCSCDMVKTCSCDYICSCYSNDTSCYTDNITCGNDTPNGWSCQCYSNMSCKCNIVTCNCNSKWDMSCSANDWCTCNSVTDVVCSCENVGSDNGPHINCSCHRVCLCDNDDTCSCNSYTSESGPACPCLLVCTGDVCPCENVCGCNSLFASCSCDNVCSCDSKVTCTNEYTCSCNGICHCDNDTTCSCDNICTCNVLSTCPCDSDYVSSMTCTCDYVCSCNTDWTCSCDNICTCNGDSTCSCLGVCSSYKADTCLCNSVCSCNLDKLYTCNCDSNYVSDKCTADVICPSECTSDVNCSCNNYVAVN